MQCACTILSPVAYPSLRYLSTFFVTGIFCEQIKLLNIKCVFWFSLQLLSETFLIIRKNERDMIKNVYRSSCKVPVILVQFSWKLNSVDRFSKNLKISNFMKIRSVGTELFHADGRTDRNDEAYSRFSQLCEKDAWNIPFFLYWFVTLTNMAGGYKLFPGICFPHLQGRTHVPATLKRAGRPAASRWPLDKFSSIGQA